MDIFVTAGISSNLPIVLILSDPTTDLDIQELANLTAGDADVDNFERLFTKLKEMKGNWEENCKCEPLQQKHTGYSL